MSRDAEAPPAVARVWRLPWRRPRVTVIMPTFNWAPVLPYSIASVLDQTFTDFELLVVGDGCTDESAHVVGSIARRDRRVRWINLPQNAGTQVAPNNEGLRRARARYVAYLGHDDLWLPHHLATLLPLLDAGAVVAMGRCARIDPGREPEIAPPVGWDYARGTWLPPTATVHRRDDVRRLGGWRFPAETGDMDPESELWARLADAQSPPVFSPHVTAIKLPAAHRRNVYRERPHHEQSAWLSRIRSAPDPEAMILAAVDEPPARDAGEPDPMDGIPLDILANPDIPAAERHKIRRAIKGLDP